jgi:hypothetical protein
MKRVISQVSSLSKLRAVRFFALLATASLLVAAPCDSGVEDVIDAATCMSDEECVEGCETLCMDDPVLASECDLSRGACVCDCDTSAVGGSGGAGSGGVGGAGGVGGIGGAPASLCGADTECTPDAPSICGTICIDPICGGFENFDTALCGDGGRCVCICMEGTCADPP